MFLKNPIVVVTILVAVSITVCDGGTFYSPTGSILRSRRLMSSTESSSSEITSRDLAIIVPLAIAVVIVFLLLIYCVKKRISSKLKENSEVIIEGNDDISLEKSPKKAVVETVELKPDKSFSELVFFADENEKFQMEELLEATADLQSHSLCSSLYKVMLKNNNTYAVKRLKLHVSIEEFRKTMQQIGNLRHQNILPLIGYHSTDEEKLLIYKYQSNGSLLDLMKNYIEGKRKFSWGLRLSIASGIARGLEFIYRKYDNQIAVPHGNLKLSNILLNENEEPLVSEYGFSKFVDPKNPCIYLLSGYSAPEKSLSEESDVYSFGVILLELLTGKTVEKSGIDLPTWVRAMVREEWTGEVFDKEVNKNARQWAFPLLNISLKCVSKAPEDRPSMAEVMEKIEEIVNDHDDVSRTSISSIESNSRDCYLLHTTIPETWDSPASNH